MVTSVQHTSGLSAMSKKQTPSKPAEVFAHDDIHASCDCWYHAAASRLHT